MMTEFNILGELWLNEWMNEWMNEWSIYIALYCVLLYTQSALQSCGGNLSSTTTSLREIHLDDVMAATGQRRQCAHHNTQLQVERRETHRANQVDGDYY